MTTKPFVIDYSRTGRWFAYHHERSSISTVPKGIDPTHALHDEAGFCIHNVDVKALGGVRVLKKLADEKCGEIDRVWVIFPETRNYPVEL